MKTLSDLRDEAVDELLAAANAEGDLATLHLRRLSELYVDMRELCPDPFGRGPDYSGRSKEYRAAVSSIYRDVTDEVSARTLDQIKNKVRYHTSTALRERLADRPEVLEEYGVQRRSVKERLADRVKQRRALVDAGIMSSEEDDPNATSRLVHSARYLLDLAAEEGLEDVTRDARDHIVSAVDQIVSHVPDLVPPAERVRLARNILSSVDDDSLKGQPEPTRERVDQELTETLEHATRLRRQTTTVENTLATIDEIAAKYAGRGSARKRA
ncbi:hypothetical protein HUO13_11990 [Saccharopolyspora erythraea]|uniref:hypothetical protein n=1 Tax=Saccharopolyspora erythraea TaxID=1836 RepID=UPI001BAD8A03|nr:hypothetical protein [Saccharopolyspora erythraea]QUH01434.1 hypothetical protein HUO13_11990 [Saccharopolyspora erythraea]